MIINHNMNALNAHRNMMGNITKSGKSMEKLSSGLRINRAGDDAAGLAISEKMRGQIRGLDQAQRNAQDGISMIQTAEGALNETHSILQRMRELATQSSNDTNTAEDRGQIQNEINQLTSEINRIGNTTEFNTQKLLKGSEGKVQKLESTAVDLATNNADLSTADFKMKIGYDGGTPEELTLSKVDYDGTGAGKNLEDLAKDIQAKIDGNANLKDKGIKVTVKDDKLVFTADKAIKLATGSGDDALAKINGLSAGDSAEATVEQDFTATLQIGANQGQAFNMTIGDMRSEALGIAGTAEAIADGKGTEAAGAKFTKAGDGDVTNGTDTTVENQALDVSSHDNATAAIEVLDQAINKVSTERSKLGAYQNRLEHTINNLGTSSENLTAAESRVRDVDMAKEMMTFSKDNILQQAAQAMLAQAKQAPQGVLQLLR